MSSITGLVKLVRPRQWIKNLFVFAPLLFTGKFTDPDALTATFAAFVLFSCAASMIYAINDLHDVNADRAHPTKRHTRSLASGEISSGAAIALVLVLALSLLAGLSQLPTLTPVCAAYIGLNLAYTYKLKTLPIVDIFCISCGFVMRVYAGAVVLLVPVSGWMFITTLSLALFLASLKRRQELISHPESERKVLASYNLSLLNRFGDMASTMSLLSYSFFVMAVRPELVYTIPFVLFGFFRYWYIVEMGKGGESPTDALVTDVQLILTVLAWLALCALALV